MTKDNEHKGLATGAAQIEKVVSELHDRLAEVLPRSEFAVTVEHGDALHIRGLGARHGDTVWITPVAVWQSSLPVEQRLHIFCEAVGRQVQKFVSGGGKPWPAATAEARVLIDDDRILLWWGGLTEADAVVALRPISRKDVGV